MILISTPSVSHFRYQNTYHSFSYLLSKDTELQIERFISKERTLNEYSQSINKILKLRQNALLLPTQVPMGLFEVEANKLNQASFFFPYSILE